MEEYSRNPSDSLCPNNEGQPKAVVNFSGPIDQAVYRSAVYEGSLSKKQIMDTMYEGESTKLTDI